MQLQVIATTLKDRIYLSKNLLNESKVVLKKAILNYGMWKREVDVEFADLPSETIGLSEDINARFCFPEEVPFELKLRGREIHIGPLIGFAVVGRNTSLTKEVFDKYHYYFSNYSKIKGVIFLCASEGINTQAQTIEGYYYCPGQTKDKRWQKGMFPYPGAMYRRTGMASSTYQSLVKHMGDRIFNGYFFDKWELWQYMACDNSLSEHLPYTEELKSFENFESMLEKYGELYLKLAASYKAKGIIKASRDEKGYHFLYRLKGEKVFKNRFEAAEFIEKLKKEDYLVQQAIKVRHFENRNIDFRVIMQKDYSKQWKCTGAIARFGKQNSIATNFILEGYALPADEAIKRAYKLDERQTFAKLQEIAGVCKNICSHLDQCVGNYGDVGVDVMIDKDLKVWVLEVNKLHDHKFPVYSIEDLQMYYKVITTPFEYAKALAGF